MCSLSPTVATCTEILRCRGMGSFRLQLTDCSLTQRIARGKPALFQAPPLDISMKDTITLIIFRVESIYLPDQGHTWQSYQGLLPNSMQETQPIFQRLERRKSSRL